MKLIITESRIERLAIKWLNDNYGDLEKYQTEEHTCCIFYIKNNNIIFEYHKKDKEVSVDYNNIWSFFESVFNIPKPQIKEILKKWVEEQYNLKVRTVYVGEFNHSEILGDNTI